jgi:hypothetical protein
MYWLLLVLMLIGVSVAEAQNPQESSPKLPGMLLEPLKSPESKMVLCVINTQNDGPQWFVFNADAWGQNERLGSFDAALMLITEIKASADGQYLAVLSVGEGHPMLEVIDLPKLLQSKSYSVLQTIDPYPGVVAFQSWNGSQLQIDSDVFLTRRDPKTGRVPDEMTLSTQETFALNVLTGEITGISEGAKNPITYYTKMLMDQRASEAEKDKALSNLLTLNPDEQTIAYLLKVLDQEKDPKRVLRLLEEIKKLRGK